MKVIIYGRHVFKVRYAVFIFCFLICTMWQSYAGFAQGLSVIRDQEIEDVLKEIASPIFEQAGFSPNDIRIVLIKSHGINAFVAGGKNIFVNTGLMLETEDSADMLGVLAHETSHIASGHLTRTQKVAEGVSFQTLLTTIVGVAAAVLAGSSDAGAAIITGGQAAAITSFLKHSRTQESAADNGGIAYLKGAGLSPKGFVRFMETLESEELLPSSQQSEYVRTHPLTRDRINFLRYATEQSPYKDRPMPIKWQQDYARAKAKLLGFVLPERGLRLKDRTSVPARYARIIALYRLNRQDEALELLSELLQKEPDNPYFYELKGQILFENGQTKPSLKAYEKAVQLLPNGGLIQIDYAHVLIEHAQAIENKNERYNLLIKAIAALQQAKRFEEHNSRLYHFLGVAYGANNQEGYARLSLAEEALLQNRMEDAERQLSYAKANLPPKAVQAKLRVQDLHQLIVYRRSRSKKK